MARTRLNKCHICGPGLSICCSLISIWGIVMLAIVGGLMTAKSAAFIEDITISNDETIDFNQRVDTGFQHAATNCYGAAGIYVGVLIFCAIQVVFNLKLSATTKQN